jgi:hypothetical protein
VCANVSITTLRVLGVAVNTPRSVMIAVLGFNLAGDGQRDALDPRFREA